jgi:hypothetical protein
MAGGVSEDLLPGGLGLGAAAPAGFEKARAFDQQLNAVRFCCGGAELMLDVIEHGWEGFATMIGATEKCVRRERAWLRT